MYASLRMRRMHSIEGSLYIEREQDYACDSAGMIGDVRFDSRQNPAPAMEHKQERSGSISVCVVCD